jgi:uncharacterized delta-60 repeat protein
MILHWSAGTGQKSACLRCGRERTISARRHFRPELEPLETRALLSSPGSLNPHFGTDGLAVTNFGADDNASGSAIQADGKIVVVGTDFSLTSPISEIALARYNKDGSLDPSFGSGGKVLTLIGAADFNSSVVINRSGKIIVEATEVDPVTSVNELLVVQYNPDGSLDQSFGQGGYVTTDLQYYLTGAIALEPDGDIVVLGNSASQIALEAFNRYGNVDKTFGSGGMVTTSFLQGVPTAADPLGFYTPAGIALTIDGEGRILVAGEASSESGAGLVVRYNADGSLDKTFGIQGAITNVFGTSGIYATAVAVRPDGKIVVAGQAGNPAALGIPVFTLEQFNPDGSPDLTFGFDGIQGTSFPNQYAEITGLVLQRNGDPIVVGNTLNASTFTSGFAMARYDPEGNPDRDFGSNGIVTTFAPNPESPFSVALEPNGDIVVTGTSFDPSTGLSDFAVAEYLPGPSEPVKPRPHLPRPPQPGRNSGSLNSGFGTGGVASTNFGGNDFPTGTATEADGKIVVVANDYSSDFSTSQLAVARYNPNGSLDPSFGSGGYVLTLVGSSDVGGAVAIRSDGEIIVAAAEVDPGTSLENILVVEYRPDGTLDGTFGSGGVVVTSLGNSQNFTLGGLTLTAGGRILVVGGSSGGTVAGGLVLAEYNRDGSLNQTFGSGGIVTTRSFIDAAGITFSNPMANAVAIDCQGRIVVAGAASNPTANVAVLARYDTNGSLDQSFGFCGAVTSVFDGPATNVFVPDGVDATTVVIRPDGKILVAGDAIAPPLGGFDASFAVEQFNPDGSPDLNFGSDGIVLYYAAYGFLGTFDATSLVLQANGDVIVVGTTSVQGETTTGFAMVRYLPDGSLDPSFGSGGVVTTIFSGPAGTPFFVALDVLNGDIVVVGSLLDISTSRYDVGLVEYLP